MQLYNTLTRSKQQFTPQDSKTATLYTCGPTVYDRPHIGNWTGYIYWDLLVRTLQDSGLSVNWYMNITDVGHLTSDADEGEDKMEKGARREGKTAWDVARFYSDDFKAGLNELNIALDQSHLTPATEHIPEQIALIQKLEDKGFTYKTSDGIYFDSSKFPEYGRLARLDIAGLQAGARVAIGEKKQVTDFALWKFSPKGTKRDMEWESPWGTGFPGWHIECSAMAMKYLGETIDIHCGGIDHIPVHHTNEIAQSEAATDKTFVKYWVHNNHMLSNGSKISKSAQNGITLQDLEAKDYSPFDFRLLVLQSHYRTQSNFTWKLLDGAHTRRKALEAFADLRFQQGDHGINQDDLDNAKKSIRQALEDDLNSPEALAKLSQLETKANKQGVSENANLQSFVAWLDAVLGLDLNASVDISDSAKAKLLEREAARDVKDWHRADQIRDELLKSNIEIRDTTNGQIWNRG